MNIERRLLIAAALLSLPAFACGAELEGEGQNDASEGVTDTEVGAATLSAGAKEAAGCTGSDHIYNLDGDGGVPSSIQARCAAVLVDGTTCTVDPSEVALSLGLDGRGWTVHATSPCFGGASLTISGVDDAPYPQTAVKPFLEETSAHLFLTDEGSDASVGAGSYSSRPSGSSTIELGPESKDGEKVVATVAGVAEVVSEATAGRRKVLFYFAF